MNRAIMWCHCLVLLGILSTIIERSLSNNETDSGYKHFKKKTKCRILMKLFTDFMISAQDSGKVFSLTHRSPLPQEILLVLISC